jgi:hypothetical protein
MTTTHTPGPWRIGDAGQTVFGPKTDHSAPVTVALMPTPSERVSFLERKANSKLVAAAPELLEALEGLVADWERVHGPIPADHEARAAISKATGA